MSKENILKAVQLIDDLNTELSELLQHDPSLQLRASSTLVRLSNGFKDIVGENVSPTSTSNDFKPLKTLFGKNVIPTEKPLVEVPTAESVKSFKEQMLIIKDTFTEQDPKELMERLTDKEIRAIAKLSGVEVTETTPERITTAFVESIQDAVVAERELAAQQQEETNKLNSGAIVLTDADKEVRFKERISALTDAGFEMFMDRYQFESTSINVKDVNDWSDEDFLNFLKPFTLNPLVDNGAANNAKVVGVEIVKTDEVPVIEAVGGDKSNVQGNVVKPVAKNANQAKK